MKIAEIEEEQQAPADVVPEPGRRLSPLVKRVLIASVAGSVVLGGVLLVLPSSQRTGPPAPGPAERASLAAAAGAAPALSDLSALITEREARVRTHPRDGRSWAVLGAAYVERGTRTADPAYYPKAERALRTSLKTRPAGNVEALNGLAALANARHDYGAAKEWGEAALKLAPKRWLTYPGLLDAYGGLGDYKAVGKALDTLTELHSGAAVMAESGQVYRDRGWREDATASLSDAAALASTPAEQAACLYRLGELAWERGEPAQALNYFDAALAADPGDHASLAGKGRALTSLGRTSDALRAYRSALDKYPRPEYALELGELYESIGLAGAARAQYDVLRARVRADGADGVDDALVLGRFEADHGDPRAAVTRLRAEWQGAPSARTADALGWALHRAGDDKEALGFVRRSTDPEHGGGVRSALFAYHRGEVERALGLAGPARRHLGEALRLNPKFSPLLSGPAGQALAALGEPPPGGPEDVREAGGEDPAPGSAQEAANPASGSAPDAANPASGSAPDAANPTSERPAPQKPAPAKPTAPAPATRPSAPPRPTPPAGDSGAPTGQPSRSDRSG
ncbi:tetratricopeptide repeat protein [Streptomyces sp. NPDC058067]|uniref:tetratricopeptide repeat protein n=1 Tax=Streptomyces sp. NPDC058067 TaxID=3346324 RepID=UPI0036E28928